MALIAALTMTATTMAQDENNQARERRHIDKTEMVKHRTAETVKAYGLDEKQAKALLELNTKFADKMGPGRGPRPGGPKGQRPEGMKKMKGQRPDSIKGGQFAPRNMGAGHEKMRQTMEEYDQELQKILTPDQYKAYKADMEKRMKEGPRGQRQRPTDDKTGE